MAFIDDYLFLINDAFYYTYLILLKVFLSDILGDFLRAFLANLKPIKVDIELVYRRLGYIRLNNVKAI